MRRIASTLKILGIFTFLVNYSLAQNNQPQKAVNVLKVEIIDIVERNHLTDLQLIIWHEKDTVNIHIDSVYKLFFELHLPGKYYAKVIKEDYDTLSIDWTKSDINNYSILEFFLPKKTLSKEEKRIAHLKSLDLPELKPENNYGFKGFRFKHNEMCVMRFRDITKYGDASLSTWEFRKFKEY